MLDPTDNGAAAWIAPLRPEGPNNLWPPTTRLIERDPAVQPLLAELGQTLSQIETDGPEALAQIFVLESVRRDLQITLAHLGAARLLQTLDWFATSQPGGEINVLELSSGETPEGKALSSSIRSLTARATVVRMFGPDRVAEIQTCAEAVNDTGEKP
jgi:hypothetical protein